MTSKQSYVTEIARLFPEQGSWSEQDYFELPESQQIIELADGELVMPAPPTPRHQRIAMKLAFELQRFADETDLGEVLMAPVAVRLEKGKVREPDVFLVLKANLDRIGESLIDGPPDWIAEVLSPATRKTDEVVKLEEYARAGVAEYWLIDPDEENIRVFVLAGRNYLLKATYTESQTARSETIDGFVVEVDDML